MMRALAAVAAAVLAPLGIVLVVLGADVRQVDAALARGDDRFRVAPSAGHAWRIEERVPGGAARRLLAVDDDLAFRRAVQLFWRGRPRLVGRDARAVAPYRAAAVDALTQIVREDGDARRRAEAANLLGILALIANAPPQERSALVASAAESFRRAVVLDGRNEEAKHNLELVLQNSAPKQGGRGGGSGTETGRPGDETGGAAVSPAGQGY